MRNKYGAKKTTVNGIVFDSKAEAAYYEQLLERKRRGEIKDFELQPKFLLQPGFKKNGETIRAINYIADFKIHNNDGSVSIVDVKGVETETFKIKRKLFEQIYPELSLEIVKAATIKTKRTPPTAEARQRAERQKRSKERRRKAQERK